MCLRTLLLTFVLKLIHGKNIKKHGLIIVDIQYDFANPLGSLSVFNSGPNSDINTYLNITSTEYVNRINTFIQNEGNRFDFIAYSIDYHPTDHCSFASAMQAQGANISAYEIMYPGDTANVGKPWEDYICISQTGNQMLWPDHCVIGSDGAKLMPSLLDIRPISHLQSSDDLQRVIIWRDGIANEEYVMNYKLAGSSIVDSNKSFIDHLDLVQSNQVNKIHLNISQVMYIFKGRDVGVDSYSVFDANDGVTRTGLFDALNAYDYTPDDTDLVMLGIAYDYCVIFTIRDAYDHGYDVMIMDQLTAPVFASAVAPLKDEMESLGMNINYTYGSYQIEDSTTTTYPFTSTTKIFESDSEDEDEVSGEMIGIIILCVVIVVLICALIYAMRRNKVVVSTASPPSPDNTTNQTGDNNADAGVGAKYDMTPLNTDK